MGHLEELDYLLIYTRECEKVYPQLETLWSNPCLQVSPTRVVSPIFVPEVSVHLDVPK